MALDQPTSSGPPAAVFPTEGDEIIVGIVDVGEYHQRDYDTDELKYWPDGGKVMGKVVTGLVVRADGTTCKGNSKAQEPVAPGDLVTFWCEGSKHFTYQNALREAGMVDVGYVMRWAREEDTPPKSAKHNPRKNYVAQIRRPDPTKDGDLAARCQAAHDELRREKALDAAPQPEPVAAGAVADDGPGF